MFDYVQLTNSLIRYGFQRPAKTGRSVAEPHGERKFTTIGQINSQTNP
jgi:hypothetical protein